MTLITMGAGNVIVLEETLKSFSHVCNEVVYGDMLLFPEDREILKTYEERYNLKIITLPFDYIFKNGFSAVLNHLASFASNNMVIYMNTSEVIEIDYGIQEKNSHEYNCYFFTHKTDPHRWFRCYNRHELKWSGRIHEDLVGEHRPYHHPIFRMADLEKDMYNSFKAKVFNDFKEIVYFQQYLKLIDSPEEIGATNDGWVRFAKEQYESMSERLNNKGERFKAVKNGDLHSYLADAYSNKDFENERFESSLKIEFQGSPMFLGK